MPKLRLCQNLLHGATPVRQFRIVGALKYIATLSLLVAGVCSGQWCRVAYSPDLQLNYQEFLESSCCMCHNFLFAHLPHLSSTTCNVTASPGGSGRAHLVIAVDGRRNVTVVADHLDDIAVDLVCRVALRGDDTSCRQWRSCCEAAANCFSSLQPPPGLVATAATAVAPTNGSALSSTDAKLCPATWDGWKCWPSAEPSSHLRSQCPSFLYPDYDCDDAQLYVTRDCTAAGTWAVDVDSGQERSDYTQCSRPVVCIEMLMKLSRHLTFGCQSVSLLSLCIALAVYLYFRNLRNQPRIQIHINLCVSMVFQGIINILYTAVVKSKTSGFEDTNSVISMNTVACRLLNALDKFALLAVYLSMLLEGFYLHWLLVSAFRQPRLRLLLGPAWGFSLAATIVYSATKLFTADELCWTSQVEAVEWVIYAPSIIAVLLNVAFLINIQRILWRQLHAHRDEPSSYRRTVKAALLLAPPFGLTVLFLLYHPSPEYFKSRAIYECCSAVILNLQGFFVVMVLCFFNVEVRNTVRNSWKKPRKLSSYQDGSLSLAHTINYSNKSESQAANSLECRGLLLIGSAANGGPARAVGEGDGGGDSVLHPDASKM